MDLNLVSQILKKIILERGKVSLPMMGSLEAEDVPAGFAQGGSIITPPSKKIVFNSFDVTNDGLLENEYAVATGETLDESKKDVAEFINSVKTSLIDESNFLIPGLGKIVFGEDFKYSFDEEESLNLSPDSFGLGSFEVEKNTDNAAESAPEIETEEEKEVAKITSSLEEKPEKDAGVANVGIPEHEPQFAKGSRAPIDYDFGGEEAPESHIETRRTSYVADAEEVRPAVKKNAEILHFSKKQNPADNKTADANEISGEKREKFIPSAGVLGGHAYSFGKPLQSEAT